MANLVILDAGHAKVTPGKRAPGGVMMEWEFNNDMQYRIKPRLEAHGIQVKLVNPNPESGSEVSLATRCSRANSYASGHNALFVSLHSNAAGNCTSWMNARGVETFTATSSSANSNKASEILVAEIYNTLKAIDGGFKNRGPKKSNFYVVKNTNCPAVLIEYAFYDNREDLSLLQNRRYDMTEATVRGLCKYFGIAYKAPGTVPPTPPDGGGNGGSTNLPNGTYNRNFRVNSPDGVLSVRDARPNGDTLGNKLGEYKNGNIIHGMYCLNNWMGVDFNGKQGFVNAAYLEDVKNDLPSLAHPFKSGTYNVKARVTATALNVRASRPGGDKYGTIYDVYNKGEIVEVHYCLDGWFSVYDHDGAPNAGFISGEYVELVLN